MDNISNTLAVAWKEIQMIVKDRGNLAILFLLPLLLGSVYGSINLQMGADSEEPAILLDVLLVNEDGATFGNQVADALKAIDELNIEEIGSLAQAGERQHRDRDHEPGGHRGDDLGRDSVWHSHPFGQVGDAGRRWRGDQASCGGAESRRHHDQPERVAAKSCHLGG